MRDLAQRPGARAALLQAEALELGGLVRDHGVEGPVVTYVFHQPGQLLVVRNVDVGWLAQCRFALRLGTHNLRNAQVPCVAPLGCLVGPHIACYTQRPKDQGFLCLARQQQHI